MSELLFANPFWILVLGVLATFGLAYAWSQTRDRRWLLGAGIAAVLTLGLFIAERLIETDREQVRRVVGEIALAVENNDVDRVLTYVDPTARQARERVSAEMPSYTFERCNVLTTNALAFDNPTAPQRAMVVFVVWVDVEAPTYGYKGNARRRVTLFFRKNDNGQWQMYDYAHEDPAQNSRYLPDDGPPVFIEPGATGTWPQ